MKSLDKGNYELNVLLLESFKEDDKYMLGGIHLSDYGHIPYMLIKRIGIAESFILDKGLPHHYKLLFEKDLEGVR